ncbi:MAG: hypothetical protein LUH22_04955 [Bacteroides sp.]|nr:hypothetical protein [Bacteroides sp.]
MTLNRLLKELELLLSDIAFTGIHHIQPVTLQKLEDLKKWMIELNMTEGIRLIDKFIQSVYEYKAGKQSVETTISSLCALEFYEKTTSGKQK